MTWYEWTVTWMLALAACSDSHDRTPGSQTHFLQACDSTCAAPYDCICGVCTLQCSNDTQCGKHSSEAQCSVAQPGGGECNADAPVCDVSCDRDRDCSALGDAFACADGRCRTVPMSIDSGAYDSGTATSTIDSGKPRDAAVIVLDSAMQSIDSGASTGGGGVTALCDGSDDIRLGMWLSGGLVRGSWLFMHPFGDYFAFIDGHCNYYASWDPMLGVQTGTVSSAQAETLALQIGWNQIDTFSAHVDQGCPDAPSSMISNGMHAYSCSCGCDDGAPPDLSASEAEAETWIQRLATDQGQPVSGSVRVLASEFTGGTPPVGLQPWPFSNRPISDVVVPEDQITGETEGVEFTDPADVDALRAMRRMAQSLSPNAQQVFVGDGDKRYLMYIRDDLPVDVDSAVRTFWMASYASRQ